MATYITVRREAYGRARRKMKDTVSTRGRYDSVRRPMRGIQARKDTYAVMKVITESGFEVPLIDGGGTPQFKDGTKQPLGMVKPYSNFFIKQWQRGEAEKSQVVQTFGDTYVHFYGENPISINFTGFLMNTVDFDWKREWWENYHRYLRGSKLVENHARLYIYIADYIYEGYLLRSSTTDVDTQPNMVAFNGMFLVTEITPVRIIGTNNFPTDGVVQADPRSRSSLGQSIIGDSTEAVESGRTKYSYNTDEFIGSSEYWDSHDNYVAMDLKEDEVEKNVTEMLKEYGVDEEDASSAARDEGELMKLPDV